MEGIKKVFPFLAWGPLINTKNIQADFIAGLTVALVLIPQSMAYAQLAGLPPIYGLYAALLPGLLGAMWGSSFHLATGPVSMTSLLTMASLAPFGHGNPHFIGSPKYIEMTILLAFMVGLVRLLVGIFRLTVMANFLSQPVIRGFINAGALIIASSQVSKIFGVHMHRSDFYLHDILDVFLNIPKEFDFHTFIIGFGALVTIFFLKKCCPKAPSALMVVVIGSLIVKFMGWYDPHIVAPNFSGPIEEGRKYVAVLGFIPAGLPKIQAPHFDISLMIHMIPGAFVVMFIGFMEFNSVNKAIAPKSGQKIDVCQEMIGQGVAALAGSFTRCYPTSGSFSRTALNFAAGGKTGMSSVFTALFVTITLLFLTQFLVYLPQSVLAAIIILAVAGLIDFKAMREAWKIDKFDGVASIVTFAASLIFAPHIVNGILAGGALALGLHLYKTMKPDVATVDSLEIQCVEGDSLKAIQYPAISFHGQLYFANAEYFENMVRATFDKFQNTKKVIVLGGAINAIDASGINMLRQLFLQLCEEGRGIVFTNLKPQIIEAFERANLLGFVGCEIYKSEDAARYRMQLLHTPADDPY